MRLFFTLVACLSTSSVFSSLSPYYQSIREIEAIIEDPRLGDVLGQCCPITSIERKGNAFHITSKEAEVRVEIHYGSSHLAGPVPFELSYHLVEKNSEGPLSSESNEWNE